MINLSNSGNLFKLLLLLRREYTATTIVLAAKCRIVTAAKLRRRRIAKLRRRWIAKRGVAVGKLKLRRWITYSTAAAAAAVIHGVHVTVVAAERRRWRLSKLPHLTHGVHLWHLLHLLHLLHLIHLWHLLKRRCCLRETAAREHAIHGAVADGAAAVAHARILTLWPLAHDGSAARTRHIDRFATAVILNHKLKLDAFTGRQ
mmetsp:Transcript_57490/g.95522  ORF Transcript_57490/g.95522 Transcript_57490/m.95522 type:complete len:202 (-) Transcript_57490:13-618(-)